MPFAALQNDAGGHHEYGDDAGEVDYVAAVDHASADGVVVVAHAKRAHKEVRVAEEPHAIDGLETQLHECTHEGGKDKCNNLVVSNSAGKESYGNKGGTQKQ